jgi:hypothetical protein
MILLLGLRYLWIDALCIRQGDESDKVKELPLMHEYYGNAHLVIQSSGTKSVDEGFLGCTRTCKISRKLNAAEKLTNLMASSTSRSDAISKTDASDIDEIYDVLTVNEPGVSFYKVPFVSQDGVASDDLFIYETLDTTWYNAKSEHAATRGWILQEELLSNRILVFPSAGGMIFRCASNETELNDGNVKYHPQSHRTLTLPRKRLLSAAEAQGMGMHLISDPLKGMIEQARKLAATGRNNHVVSIAGTSGCLIINHDLSEKIDVPEDGYIIAPVYGETETEGPNGNGSTTQTVSPYAALLIARNPNYDSSEQESGPELRGRRIFTDAPPHTITAEGLNQAWKDTVDNYCQRKPSNPGDKLIAIAALARQYAAQYGDGLGRYVAGMWEAFLPETLLWKVYPNQRETRPSSLGVPSWSWAAVEGARFEDSFGEDEHDLKSSSCEIKIVGGDLGIKAEGMEYEAITSGSLKIRGKLLGCSWERSQRGLSCWALRSRSRLATLASCFSSFNGAIGVLENMTIALRVLF